MKEAQTEFELIEPALKSVGWGLVEGSRIQKQFPITQGRLIGNNKRSKPLRADYVLVYKNQILAVLEGKSDEKYYTEGVGQAKDYANRLQVRYAYATNGKRNYFIDRQEGLEYEIDKYPSPEELWEMTYPKPEDERALAVYNWEESLLSIPFEDRSGTWQLRYYQLNAINNVITSIAKGEKRILLTLATGTGKTAIAFQIAWKLFHARWNLRQDRKVSPRILFLADRNILANQAFNAFSAFEEDALVRISPDEIRKKGRIPTNGSIFFTIFQTFMCGDDETPYFGEYPEDFFDLIIIDECHRGGANDESNWRGIMEYFSPAVQLGLTATPRRDVNIDTYRYFGEPVYTYSLKEGINDGYLTPFKVVEIDTTIDMYSYSEDDILLDGEIDREKEYREKDFNRKIEIREREKYRIEVLLGLMNQKQKTLVFCAIQRHALLIRDLINQLADSDNVDYCHRVTADDGILGEQHLKEFQDNERSIPTILTTSHKLSTGVDAPEVMNIVLLRPVRSIVEFKQIIGRGTRLFEGKDYFTIYDFVNAHEHFKDEDWDGEPIAPERIDAEDLKETEEVKEEEPEYGQAGNEEEETADIEYGAPEIADPKKKRIPMIEVQLSDLSYRSIDHMVKTTFWSTDGTPVSAAEFIRQLFGEIPSLFANEEELRRIWSLPKTRKQLLEELEDRGYSLAQLEELQKLVHGEDSDLFDVLSYIAYHKNMVPRLERAERAKIFIKDYDAKQQKFLDFVLEQYVKSGVNELDEGKLPELLILKYDAIADAKTALGGIEKIRKTFIDFQVSLYKESVG